MSLRVSIPLKDEKCGMLNSCGGSACSISSVKGDLLMLVISSRSVSSAACLGASLLLPEFAFARV